MSIIVQKFGGALLATPQGRREAAAQVIATRDAGRQVVAVASAIGGAGGPQAGALTAPRAGIETTGDFGEARILRIDPTPIRRHLDARRIVVVAGFQGVTADGEVTTLGRGGSDTTAVALGAALGAELVEI